MTAKTRDQRVDISRIYRFKNGSRTVPRNWEE
jgi:hypothetical protein